jgi:hypothetical protein
VVYLPQRESRLSVWNSHAIHPGRFRRSPASPHYHFTREKVTRGEIELVYMESKNQLANYLIKGMSTKTLRYLRMPSNIGPKLEMSN